MEKIIEMIMKTLHTLSVSVCVCVCELVTFLSHRQVGVAAGFAGTNHLMEQRSLEVGWLKRKTQTSQHLASVVTTFDLSGVSDCVKQSSAASSHLSVLGDVGVHGAARPLSVRRQQHQHLSVVSVFIRQRRRADCRHTETQLCKTLTGVCVCTTKS